MSDSDQVEAAIQQAETQAEELLAAGLLQAKMRHPTYTPASERVADWDKYHRLIDPDRD